MLRLAVNELEIYGDMTGHAFGDSIKIFLASDFFILLGLIAFTVMTVMSQSRELRGIRHHFVAQLFLWIGFLAARFCGLQSTHFLPQKVIWSPDLIQWVYAERTCSTVGLIVYVLISFGPQLFNSKHSSKDLPRE